MKTPKNIEEKVMNTGTNLLAGAVLGVATGGLAYVVTQSAVLAGAVAGLIGAYAHATYAETPNYKKAPEYAPVEQYSS